MSLAEEVGAAGVRLCTYLMSRFDDSGAARASPNGIQYYYKMPATFAFAGRLDLASTTLAQFEARFFRKGELDTLGDPLANLWIPYIAGWIGWGAAMLGRFDLGRAVVRSAADLQRSDGGFRVDAADTAPADIQRTGAALMGLVWNQERQAADAAASFLQKMIDRQANQTRFSALFTEEGQFAFDPEDRNTFFELSDSFARPAMFATPIAGLVWQYRVTGNEIYLCSARRYLHLILSHPAAPTLALATKAGWAALLVHAHSRQPKISSFAIACATAQIERQQPDGSIDFSHIAAPPQHLNEVWQIGWGCDSLLTLRAVEIELARRGGIE